MDMADKLIALKKRPHGAAGRTTMWKNEKELEKWGALRDSCVHIIEVGLYVLWCHLEYFAGKAKTEDGKRAWLCPARESAQALGGGGGSPSKKAKTLQLGTWDQKTAPRGPLGGGAARLPAAGMPIAGDLREKGFDSSALDRFRVELAGDDELSEKGTLLDDFEKDVEGALLDANAKLKKDVEAGLLRCGADSQRPIISMLTRLIKSVVSGAQML